jgi:hypothetical protein
MDDTLRTSKDAAWCPSGFKLSEDGGLLRFESLNPQVEFSNRFTRWELVKLGLWLLRRAL